MHAVVVLIEIISSLSKRALRQAEEKEREGGRERETVLRNNITVITFPPNALFARIGARNAYMVKGTRSGAR